MLCPSEHRREAGKRDNHRQGYKRTFDTFSSGNPDHLISPRGRDKTAAVME
jgi:hypothetical protein